MDIWQKPIFLPYMQPPLTDEIINEAEKKLGYKLPTDYINILKQQNGGYIRYEFDENIQDIPNSIICGIGPYFPSLTDSSWDDYMGEMSFELNGLIPFDGDGHWFICLDYRNNRAEPAVTYVDIESDRYNIVAESFGDYLSLLKLPENDNYIIGTILDISQATTKIAEILNITWGTAHSYNHGYLTYTGKFESSWIWISPNKVTKGYIRSNDERFDEFKSQDDFSILDEQIPLAIMKETVLLYPQFPPSSLIMSMSDKKVQEKVVRILQENLFQILPVTNTEK